METSAQDEGNYLHVKRCGAEAVTKIVIMMIFIREKNHQGGIMRRRHKGGTRGEEVDIIC